MYITVINKGDCSNRIIIYSKFNLTNLWVGSSTATKLCEQNHSLYGFKNSSHYTYAIDDFITWYGLNYTILSNRPFKLDMIDLDYKIGLAR